MSEAGTRISGKLVQRAGYGANARRRPTVGVGWLTARLTDPRSGDSRHASSFGDIRTHVAVELPHSGEELCMVD